MEVYSIEYSYKDPNAFISSSADSEINLWNLKNRKIISSYRGARGVVYKLNWHPTNPKMFASGGTDGLLRI